MIPELINKEKRIQDLVEYLIAKHGSNRFLIKDHWVIDDTAIGLADLSEQYLVYISTAGFEVSQYYVALEDPAKNGSDLPYTPAGDYDNLDLAEVEEMILRHLRIKK